ncbi:MAG TPA: hypothetical protein VMW32_09130, partial [Bacteroidales bacterium]|nr:hypothetical protein [Bacteroidales bacterium]
CYPAFCLFCFSPISLSVGLSLMAPKEFENVIVILSVTTLAVMAAFISSRDFKKKASCTHPLIFPLSTS